MRRWITNRKSKLTGADEVGEERGTDSKCKLT